MRGLFLCTFTSRIRGGFHPWWAPSTCMHPSDSKPGRCLETGECWTLLGAWGLHPCTLHHPPPPQPCAGPLSLLQAPAGVCFNALPAKEHGTDCPTQTRLVRTGQGGRGHHRGVVLITRMICKLPRRLGRVWGRCEEEAGADGEAPPLHPAAWVGGSRRAEQRSLPGPRARPQWPRHRASSPGPAPAPGCLGREPTGRAGRPRDAQLCPECFANTLAACGSRGPAPAVAIPLTADNIPVLFLGRRCIFPCSAGPSTVAQRFPAP